MVRADSKVRLYLYRKGQPRIISNWHHNSKEAFAHIQAKCISMKRDVPAMSHKEGAGVKFIHQLYGLFRDGKEMSPLFKQSSSAWQQYAIRHQANYKLWTADEVDTLILLKAPSWLTVLYRDLRFPVQRADVGRFFILYKYGGLYADLDVFPNLEKFPLVPLGLCKVLAMDAETKRVKPEWETEVVVATERNELILEILWDMCEAMAEEGPTLSFYDKPCRFIHDTTGPRRVGRFVVSKGYEPQVTVFSMCRPEHGLSQHLSFDNTGRVLCHLPGKGQYDVWSAFSMSYNTGPPLTMPPLAMPLAQLPPYPPKKKRRRYSVKTTPVEEEMQPAKTDEVDEQTDKEEKQPAKTDEVDKQTVKEEMHTISGSEQQPETQLADEKMQRGYEPQSLTPEARAAFDNMVEMFLTQGRHASVGVAYEVLPANTRRYLRSLKLVRGNYI